MSLGDKLHAPDVGSAFGIAALRNEVDVLPVTAPAGAEVVGSMVGVLHQLGAIGAHGVDIGVPIGEVARLYLRAAHKEQAGTVGAEHGRGEAAFGGGDDALFHPGGIVDFPNLAAPLGSGARAIILRSVGSGIRVQPGAIV